MSFERNKGVKDTLEIGHGRHAIKVDFIWLIKKNKNQEPGTYNSFLTEEGNEDHIPDILDRLSKGEKNIKKMNIFKNYVGFIIIAEGGKMLDPQKYSGKVLSFREKFYKLP